MTKQGWKREAKRIRERLESYKKFGAPKEDRAYWARCLKIAERRAQ